jgi:hypothetical protein
VGQAGYLFRCLVVYILPGLIRPQVGPASLRPAEGETCYFPPIINRPYSTTCKGSLGHQLQSVDWPQSRTRPRSSESILGSGFWSGGDSSPRFARENLTQPGDLQMCPDAKRFTFPQLHGEAARWRRRLIATPQFTASGQLFRPVQRIQGPSELLTFRLLRQFMMFDPAGNMTRHPKAGG